MRDLSVIAFSRAAARQPEAIMDNLHALDGAVRRIAGRLEPRELRTRPKLTL